MFVHPYADPAVIAGQGTAALELLASAGPLDAVVVPVGGGGLAAGTALTLASSMLSDTDVLASYAEIDSDRDLWESWRRVRRVRMRTQDGYTVSELTAAAAVQRVLAGDWSPGFQTPAAVFGADFILGLGCAVLEAAPAGALA